MVKISLWCYFVLNVVVFFFDNVFDVEIVYAVMPKELVTNKINWQRLKMT